MPESNEIISRSEHVTMREGQQNLSQVRLDDPKGNAVIVDEATHTATVYTKPHSHLAVQCRPDYADVSTRINELPLAERGQFAEFMAQQWLAVSNTYYDEVVAPPNFIPNLCKKPGEPQK